MNILTLSIKQQYFDDILKGLKTHEYREVRPNNARRYFRYEHGGKLYTPQVDDDEMPDDDQPVTLVPVRYDAIKFLTGAYSGKRPWMTVEVKDAQIYTLSDDDGDDIEYEWEDGKTYLAAQIDYHLGRVIEAMEGIEVPADREETAAKTDAEMEAEEQAQAQQENE